MRDFAVAAGIASSAFGAKAVGPLGIYGLLVLLLVLLVGAAVARVSSPGRLAQEPERE
jgi:hypothetical protein